MDLEMGGAEESPGPSTTGLQGTSRKRSVSPDWEEVNRCTPHERAATGSRGTGNVTHPTPYPAGVGPHDEEITDPVLIHGGDLLPDADGKRQPQNRGTNRSSAPPGHVRPWT